MRNSLLETAGEMVDFLLDVHDKSEFFSLLPAVFAIKDPVARHYYERQVALSKTYTINSLNNYFRTVL